MRPFGIMDPRISSLGQSAPNAYVVASHHGADSAEISANAALNALWLYV